MTTSSAWQCRAEPSAADRRGHWAFLPGGLTGASLPSCSRSKGFSQQQVDVIQTRSLGMHKHPLGSWGQAGLPRHSCGSHSVRKNSHGVDMFCQCLGGQCHVANHIESLPISPRVDILCHALSGLGPQSTALAGICSIPGSQVEASTSFPKPLGAACPALPICHLVACPQIDRSQLHLKTLPRMSHNDTLHILCRHFIRRAV